MITIRKRGSVLGLGLGALVFALTPAGVAQATTFVVNATVDAHDAQVGDGICKAANNFCTLRAAFEESNSRPTADTVLIPGAVNSYLLTEKNYEKTGNLAVAPLDIYDNVAIQGDGAGVVKIDSGNLAPILRVRTLETFMLDNVAGRIVSAPWNGGQKAFFGTGTIQTGLKLVESPTSLPGLGFEQDYLVSTLSSGVLRFSHADGTPKGTAIPATVNGHLLSGSDILFGVSGQQIDDHIFISNLQPGGGVYHFGPTGTFINVIDTAGEGAQALEWLYNNGAFNLLVLLPTRIARYDVAGTFLGNLTTVVPSSPRDILVRDKIVYLASEGDNGIQKFDATSGASLGYFVTPGLGGLNKPQSMEFAPSGELFVYSNGNNTILKYDGTAGTFAGTYVSGGSTGLASAGSFLFRFARANGPSVTISGITMANGGNRTAGDESCFTVYAGAYVEVSYSTIRDCRSSEFGGGVQNRGTLLMRSVSITGNSMPDPGGGQTSQGGGIFNSGILSVEDSFISGNYAGKGGGVSTDGFLKLTPRTSLVNTTITGNSAEGQGAGVRAGQGGIANVSFCTIVDNTSPVGRGTVAEPYGGGIYADLTSTIYLGNSVVARNINNNVPKAPDCYGVGAKSIVSLTDNFIGAMDPATCVITDFVTGVAPTDLKSGTVNQPLESGLAPQATISSGGLYPSFAVMPGSPLIDGDLTATAFGGFNCLFHDQNGSVRPQDGNGDGNVRCDLGAVEKPAATANDLDGDGIDNAIDPTPSGFSLLFSDAPAGGNTSGKIVSFGAQFVKITDVSAGGVTLSAAANGGSQAATFSLCNDNVAVTLQAGQTKTIACVTANAGSDQTVQCTGQGKATVTLSGSGSALSGGAVTFAWSAPGVTLQNATQATASGSFPVGTKVATLQVKRGTESASDTANIIVVDTVGPTLTVPADVVASSCTSVSLGQATATDSCGAGTVSITNDAPASFKAGVRIVTWRATDASGNQTVKTQKVTVGLGDNAACCPSGSNVIVGNISNNTLTGTAAVDCILGKGGQDTLKGMGGDDFISGGDGDDNIDGGDGNDVISGDLGQDVLRGGLGNDAVIGGGGDDQCYGGDGDDVLSGDIGNDKLYGENGNDALNGGDGDDRLEGGVGNDALSGGNQNDICLGGSGTNTLLSCEVVQ